MSRFTPDARAEAAAANRAPIGLVNGDRLLDLLMENEIGVTQKRVTIYELDEALAGTPSTEEPSQPEASARPRSLSPRLGKPLSVWPLPGGRSAWKDSLDRMLEFVAGEAPTMDAAIRWLIDSFERASSEKTAQGYWQVPRSFGLLETRGEQLTLTADGASYIGDPTAQALLRLLRENVAGFTEILGYLAERPHRVEELLDRLRADLGVTWETDAQINFRLGWLENLGVARVDEDAWDLTKDG